MHPLKCVCQALVTLLYIYPIILLVEEVRLAGVNDVAVYMHC